MSGSQVRIPVGLATVLKSLTMKRALTQTLLLAACATFVCSSAHAGTYANDFNSDPAADPNFSMRPSAIWRPTGSYNGSGYISLTDAIASQQGTIVLPDFDGGAV